MAIDRLPGTGRGNSDAKFFICTGGFDCGVGIDRLGNGGSLFIDGGGSKVRFTGVCRVGINGALL